MRIQKGCFWNQESSNKPFLRPMPIFCKRTELRGFSSNLQKKDTFTPTTFSTFVLPENDFIIWNTKPFSLPKQRSSLEQVAYWKTQPFHLNQLADREKYWIFDISFCFHFRRIHRVNVIGVHSRAIHFGKIVLFQFAAHRVDINIFTSSHDDLWWKLRIRFPSNSHFKSSKPIRRTFSTNSFAICIKKQPQK